MCAKNLLFPVLLIFTLIIGACDPQTQKPQGKDADTTHSKLMSVPEFSADSAYVFIQQQVDFGPRVCNTDAHKKCAAILAAKLSTYTNDVIVQSAKVRAFDGSILEMSNIIASFGKEKSNRVFLAAHWDSRPFADHDPVAANHKKPILGADDGGSGVGVLLEIARLMKITPPSVGIDIILFDAEDYGEPQGVQTGKEDTWCLGSQYWAKNPHVVNYTARYGILLDMVGAKNAKFPKEGTSTYYAPQVVNKVWGTAMKLGFYDFFLDVEDDGIVDDHLYINRILNVPTIDIVHRTPDTPTGFGAHWHTMNDNMDIIDKKTLKAVGQTVLQVVYEE